jgi:hypothetical protein
MQGEIEFKTNFHHDQGGHFLKNQSVERVGGHVTLAITLNIQSWWQMEVVELFN